MKLFIIAFLSFHFGFFDIQEDKMSGKYKMEYEEKFSTQNCVITIKDSTYERKLLNGKTVKGKIIYKKFSVELKDADTNLQMDFYKGDISRDTIFFGTKDLNKTVDNNDIVINSGKLIKLKK